MSNKGFDDEDQVLANKVAGYGVRCMIAEIDRLAPKDFDKEHRDLLLAMAVAASVIHGAALAENTKIAVVAVHTLVEAAVANKWPGFENVTIERRN